MTSATETMLSKALRAANDGRCEQEIILGRYAAGDLDEAELAAFETHVADCEECRSDLQQYETATAQEQSAPSEPISAINNPWSRFLSWWSSPRLAFAGALAVAVLLVAIVPRLPTDDVALVAKGQPQLFVAAERNGDTFRVVPGMHLQDGDELGFFYTSPKAVYLQLFHVTQGAEITLLFPAGKTQSASVQAGTRVALPDGAVLSQGSAGCEWFIALFSEQALSQRAGARAIAAAVDKRRGCELPDFSQAGIDAQVLQVNR